MKKTKINKKEAGIHPFFEIVMKMPLTWLELKISDVCHSLFWANNQSRLVTLSGFDERAVEASMVRDGLGQCDQ